MATALHVKDKNEFSKLESDQLPALNAADIARYSNKYFTIYKNFLPDIDTTEMPSELVDIVLKAIDTKGGVRIGVFEEDNTSTVYVWINY